MTFYQELQLNQAGSKARVKSSRGVRERWTHIGIYGLKIALTLAFCVAFVAAYRMLFGSENSIVGVVVLLCVMVFRQADLGVGLKESAGLFALFFAVMMVGPHAANQAGPVIGLGINLMSLLVIMVLGCHDPAMSNQSTLVLGYLLLYGYDVSGGSLRLRVLGLALGCALTVLVFWKNHRGRTWEKHVWDILAGFRPTALNGRWQLSLALCVSLVLCISELCGMPKAMWAGIAAMSATVPEMHQMKKRVWGRVIGNIGGSLCFLLLFCLLPPSAYAYIGILGGIGVGLSVRYGWQAVFNTFGALAVAEEVFGLLPAIHLRVLQNVFGAAFALVFCLALHELSRRWPVMQTVETAQTEDGEGA